MSLHPRGIGGTTAPILGYFSPDQNEAILVTGLVCGCLSLVATLVTLRWFVSMRRLFRHHLVLLLIMSDTFKALWYFVSPVVVFARGPVNSASKWCQASGFFLSLGIEASDFGILLIAVHAGLYVFRPPTRSGEGGLYPLRYWIPLFWLGYPLVAASLAFINPDKAYVTAGTFCYLPQRPIWYRLALAWIPRYLILITIFAMYAAISIHVHIKFKGFRYLEDSDHFSQSYSEKRQSAIAPDVSAGQESPPVAPVKPDSGQASQSNTPRSHSYSSPTDLSPKANPPPEPWDAMNFLTSRPLQHLSSPSGVITEDFAKQPLMASDPDMASKEIAHLPMSGTHPSGHERVGSGAPGNHSFPDEEESAIGSRVYASGHNTSRSVVNDPLKKTRAAIRHQLRALFLYPIVYVLLWAFPFATNARLFRNSTASSPIFWLQVLATVSMSLQAGVDCVVFSWREKPWRRIDRTSKLSIPFWRDRSMSFARSVHFGGSVLGGSRHASSATAGQPPVSFSDSPATTQRVRDANWWEAEGRKRKDSVWLGTDVMTQIVTRQNERGRLSQEDRSASV